MILLTLSHTAAYMLMGITALVVGAGIGILLSSTVMRNDVIVVTCISADRRNSVESSLR